MATLNRLIADANPMKGWDLPYRIAMVVIAIVMIAAWSVVLVPPILGAELGSIEAALPTNPVIGEVYYSPWRTRYVNKYGTREYYTDLGKAVSSKTWQTSATWPQGRIAEQSRFALVYNGNTWDLGSSWLRNTGLFSLWGVECTVSYRYNGFSVYTDDSNSCHSWGVGYAVSVERITWNEGGQYWGGLSYGADYIVSVVAEMIPIHFGHWMRQGIRNDGALTAPQGA